MTEQDEITFDQWCERPLYTAYNKNGFPEEGAAIWAREFSFERAGKISFVIVDQPSLQSAADLDGLLHDIRQRADYALREAGA